MNKKQKRHYWIINMDEYVEDWEHVTVRQIRDKFIECLEKNMKYISVINQKGENMFTTEGYSTKDLDDEPWIEVYDEDGNLDIEETANVVTKDLLDNRALIGMRFEKDMYDELGKDKSWINDILDKE